MVNVTTYMLVEYVSLNKRPQSLVMIQRNGTSVPYSPSGPIGAQNTTEIITNLSSNPHSIDRL